MANIRVVLDTLQTGWRQAVRVSVGTSAAFAAYKLIGLQQGYWAVFTVLIVMQGSIGGTLGAATDRLIGTIAGALLGGAAAVLMPPSALGLGGALAVVTGATVLMATARPQLKAAPVTAAIMLLTHNPALAEQRFVVDRVLEIALGGFIGVLTSVLVLPARSRTLLVERIAAVLGEMAGLLESHAAALDGGERQAVAPDHVAIRQALTAIEQAMGDAERERSSGLADHRIPAAVPRTLWRMRNDIVLIGRAIDVPLPQPAAVWLAPAAAGLLRAEAEHIGRCGAALRSGTFAAEGDAAAHGDAFRAALDQLRGDHPGRSLRFDEAGRVFGMAFALEQLQRDVADLALRIGEVAAAAPV